VSPLPEKRYPSRIDDMYVKHLISKIGYFKTFFNVGIDYTHYSILSLLDDTA
jgi:hypothetical protein